MQNVEIIEIHVFEQTMESQLTQWNREIAGFGYEGIKDADNWPDAFGNLNTIIEKTSLEGNKCKNDNYVWSCEEH